MVDKCYGGALSHSAGLCDGGGGEGGEGEEEGGELMWMHCGELSASLSLCDLWWE